MTGDLASVVDRRRLIEATKRERKNLSVIIIEIQ